MLGASGSKILSAILTPTGGQSFAKTNTPRSLMSRLRPLARCSIPLSSFQLKATQASNGNRIVFLDSLK